MAFFFSCIRKHPIGVSFTTKFLVLMNGHGVIPLTSLKLLRPVEDTALHLNCKCKCRPFQYIFKAAVHRP